MSRLLLGETPGAESVAAPSQPQAGDESRNAAGNAAAPTVRRTTVRGLTVRQHELFADLVAALKTKSISLPLVATFDPALALKLFAVLIAAAPRWSGDPLAATLIERLLHALAEVGRADDSDRVMSLLREGKPDKALRFAAADRRAQAMAAYRFLATVLDAEPELVQAVETTSGSPPKSAEATVVETRAAGAFLLVRALIDSRFAGWAPTLVDSRRDETLA
ncbi:MAG: hypothetical protein GY736_06770, partial [Sphingomonas sp.]|uniref:hypothetical protein n=1 Tax=Sphingomonas sp. TaxID=28214 RepID=UPI0025829553